MLLFAYKLHDRLREERCENGEGLKELPSATAQL